MKGIDISHHNCWPFNTVTESAYKEAGFVVVKATQWETTYRWEDYFHKAIARAAKDGKLLGAYHYMTGLDPIKEADHFLKVIKDWIGKAILALDVEKGDNVSWGSKTWARKFCDRVYEKTGIYPFIYTGVEGCIYCANCADVCPLWFAGYPKGENGWNVPVWPSRYKIAPWKNYSIWQFTSNGVDRNTSPLTKEQWLKAAGYKENKTVTTVKIGSARIDEKGKTTGGAAGDQTGNEVGTQDWYLHSKGWYVLRPNNYTIADKIASAMERACANNKIGYDQNQRNTLYNAAAKVGWDPGRVTTKVETDCSALVRVCLAYAGIKVGDFNTATEKNTLLSTGYFTNMADYVTKSQDSLRRGDILITRSKGHTGVVLSNGKLAQTSQEAAGAKKDTSTSTSSAKTKKGYSGAFPKLPPRGYYRRGDGTLTLRKYKDQIVLVQKLINWITGAGLSTDGKYGPKTVKAVTAAQKILGTTQDGQFGKNTLAKAKAFKK